MAHFACTLCHSGTESVQFDLQKTVTPCTKTSLLTLLQSCIKKEFVMNSYLICRICYLLLNDLDTYKYKAKSIEEKLESYVNQYYIQQFDITIGRYEESDNKIDGKYLRSHSKSCNLETNVLNPSFDFVNVDSVLDINSTVEDINLTISEDLREKSRPLPQSVKVKGKDTTCIKPYICALCPKTWKTIAELKNHMSSHTNEKPYVCEICGQAYKKQKALTIHVGMHKGINPFTCIYCNKSFTQKGALVRHIPIHTGDLPHQCDLCGKRFLHRTSFKVHKLSHSGTKSYKCEVCGLMLMSGSHLKRHMRVHTGEKKFVCSTCGKKFAEKYNLAVHEKLHLGISKRKKYECHICGNFYDRPVKLEEHLLNVHQKVEYSNEVAEKLYKEENVKCE